MSEKVVLRSSGPTFSLLDSIFKPSASARRIREKKQQKRLNKIQDMGPCVHGDHGAVYRCKISPLKVVKYSTFVFSGGKQPRELTTCIFKQSPAFAPRPQSFSFPTSAPLCASYPPRADVRHFTANAALFLRFFLRKKKKAKKQAPCIFVRLGGIVLLLFVGIPACREHLGVQRSLEAAAAGALHVKLANRCLFSFNNSAT